MNYYCMYCDQRCHKMMTDSPWWTCEPCGARFKDTHGLEIIEFIRKIDDNEDRRRYRLELHLSANRTKVICIEAVVNTLAMDWEDTEWTILDLKKAMTSVKPENVVDKIKTLLLFQ